MRLETEIRDGAVILRLKGRFVTGSDAELLSLKSYLQGIGISNAVIDLQGVPYIDSTGLAFVVELHKALQKRGGQIALANANQRVREILALTRIGGLIPVLDNVETALAALRTPDVLACSAGS
jgi:anti-anti-sigma factor